MLKMLWPPVRGIISLLIYLINTVFWSVPIIIGALLKLLIPIKPWKTALTRMLNTLAMNWVGVNKITQHMFANTQWDISGIENLTSQSWYLVVANHQSWVDILVLQNIFYQKIPFLKFFLKQELFWFPILGQAWWALDFPFMKRYSPSFLKKHPQKKGKDIEITRKACKKFRLVPVSIINFVEGTRFTKEKNKKQNAPYKNLLKTKAGGLAFVLASMGDHFQSFLDVTIVYPNGKKSFWEFLCGNVKEIKVRVKTLPINTIPRGDYFKARNFRAEFHSWLNTLWQEKDRYIEEVTQQRSHKSPEQA
jgi:1-acyl-sn-glycerol-3-phosphate acyltransferase